MSSIKLKIPEKCADVLLTPARWKVLFGGRGSGKSHSVARWLLVCAVSQNERILCTREVQKSIKDSVHKLLSDLIDEMNLGSWFRITNDSIVCPATKSEFLFKGLSDQTSQSVKSMEKVTKCWIEEGQTITKRSLQILTPTIRAPGSEIIVTFNPDLDTDPMYLATVTNTPPDCRVAHVNFNDNPFFPEVLEQEREYCERTEPYDTYANIWLGQCRAAATGAIYANEVAKAFADGRVCVLPYDPRLKVHMVWDMGFGDNMCVIFAQRFRSEVRIIDYLQERLKRTDEVGAMVKERRYNFGYTFLPHDGFHKVRGTGKSDADILRSMGFTVRQVPDEGREDGIRNARNTFHQIVFEKVKTQLLLESLRRYRRAETRTGGDGHPVHDTYSDGADCYRYLCLVINKMINEEDMVIPRVAGFQPFSGSMGY